MTRYRHEYAVLRKARGEHVIHAHDLAQIGNTLVLSLEDIGGRSLADHIRNRRLSLSEFLDVAMKITKGIGELHDSGVIHKNVTPENVVWNPDTGQLKLIDLAISATLDSETPGALAPSRLEGTLGYISPEQTGRMNRSLDYRTDFYSLGVVFYRLLTGRLPFESTDPLELIHSHIALPPLPPSDADATIPSVVSGLIVKLMAKNAEERYQSANGVRADLEECRRQMDSGRPVVPFAIGQNDYPERFQLPSKLYGRQREVGILAEALQRVCDGGTELTLVAGYSGVGKTSLVQELFRPLTAVRGRYLSGKYDQYGRNTPYSAIAQAFNGLCDQLLCESESVLETWRARILDAIGGNGQVLIDVIPHLEWILGTQPSVATVGAQEALNRFNLSFQAFIQAVCRPEEPLVVFLDDLQWADSASLSLLQAICTAPDTRGLHILGAYRDNEVDAAHPLLGMVASLQESGAPLATIELGNLTAEDVAALVADTLRRDPAATRPLANLIYQKTQGYAFFIGELLKSIRAEALIWLDTETRCWQWDIAQIEDRGFTDNVVDMVLVRLRRLPGGTRRVLQHAACLGSAFDLATLATVLEQTEADTWAELELAVQKGLLLPLEKQTLKVPNSQEWSTGCQRLKFLHDRVQQAAYALIPEEQIKRLHLRVGQLLHGNTSSAELEENIFDIVNHLNIGADLIDRPEVRLELARLNLMATRKAKTAAAYEPARRYARLGLARLPEDSWETQYDLSVDLHVEAVETEYLNIDFANAQRLSEIVVAHARTPLDVVRVYELQILFQIAHNQMHEANDAALQLVELLDYPLSRNPEDLKLVSELPDLDGLEAVPEMTDPTQLAVLQILAVTTSSTYQADQDLLQFVGYKMVNLCPEYGNSPLAAYAYGIYGMLLCGPLNDIERGYHAGPLSLKLLDLYPAQQLHCKVYFLWNSFIRHWKEPHEATIPALIETSQIGFEAGDITFGAYCCTVFCGCLILAGTSLDSAERI